MLKVVALLVLLGAAALTQTAARHTSRAHKGAAGNHSHPSTKSTTTTSTSTTKPTDGAGSTTESPASDEYNADLAADYEAGESRVSDGFEVVDAAPKWLGILYSKKLIYKSTGDYFGGVMILVNDTRAIVHLSTLVACKTPHHMVNGVVMFAYGFGRNVFEPKNSLKRRDTTDIEVAGDEIFGEWFLVGPTARLFHQDRSLIPTQQQLGLTPEIESDMGAAADDCYLYTYRVRNGLRRLVTYRVIMGTCVSTQYYCHFRQDLERHGNNSGVCDGRYDMGAPILCKDKLSYLVGIYDGRNDCGAGFRAVKLATFHSVIYSPTREVHFNRTAMDLLRGILQHPMEALTYTAKSFEDPIMPIQDVGLESRVLKYLVVGAYSIAEKVFG